MDSNFSFGAGKTSESSAGLSAEAWARPARAESSGSDHIRDLFKDRGNQQAPKLEGPKPGENKQENKPIDFSNFSWSMPGLPKKPVAPPAPAPAPKPEAPKADASLPPLRIVPGTDEKAPRRGDDNKPLRAGLSHRYDDI